MWPRCRQACKAEAHAALELKLRECEKPFVAPRSGGGTDSHLVGGPMLIPVGGSPQPGAALVGRSIATFLLSMFPIPRHASVDLNLLSYHLVQSRLTRASLHYKFCMCKRERSWKTGSTSTEKLANTIRSSTYY